MSAQLLASVCLCFASLGAFLAIISLSTLSILFSFLASFWDSGDTNIVGSFIRVQQIPEALFQSIFLVAQIG